jgi:Na+/citrate or Na+/malate symporter
MTFGLRTLLLLIAVIVFIVAALSEDHQGDLIASGLAVFAAGFLISEIGWDRKYGPRRT